MPPSDSTDKDYGKRRGYAEDFLQPGRADTRVLLPSLTTPLQQQAARFIADPSKSVLNYHNFSVVMHARRRFAIYSAANVDFNGRFDLLRPRDVWRFDPRIEAAAQVGESLYVNNQFDRGHLTRREGLEFGASPEAALSAAADTCHWTNCTPQHARFNEGKQLWQGIERHILESAVVFNRFRAQVITGPVFDDRIH